MNQLIRKKMKVVTIAMAVVLILTTVAPVLAANYTYDNLNRLTSVEYENGQKIIYTYDAGGNMLNAGASSVAYHVYGDVLLNGAAKSGTTVSITGGGIDFAGGYGTAKDTVYGKIFVGDCAVSSDRISYYFDVPFGNYTITAANGSQNASASITTHSNVSRNLGYGTYYVQEVAEISLSTAATLTGITLDTTLYGLAVGETRNTVVTAVYSDGKTTDVTGLADYRSSNPAVATFSPSGVITGLSPGSAEITATYGGKTAAAMVMVTASTVPVTGVTLDKTAINLTTVGPVATLTATVLPDNATNKSVTWISANPAVASVTANGNTAAITPLAVGNTHVTASTGDGGLTATCTVTVAAGTGYVFSGILKPINADGSSVFKLNSAVPVKFRLRNADGKPAIGATARLYLSRLDNGVPGKETEAVSSGGSNTGNLFRYDNGEDLYIFNLKTKDLSAGTWRLRIDLDDGSSQYVNIGLR